LSKTATNLRDRHAVAIDNRPLAFANENFARRQQRQSARRDLVLILLALHRRLEQIYPQSAEAVEIRALIDRLSKPAAADD